MQSMTHARGETTQATCPVAFADSIVPTAISASYRLGLLLVTIGMIVVPLLYLLLIVAVAWFLLWHLTTNGWLLSGSGASQWRLFGFVTPVVIGITLLFFMVKPVLARRKRRDEPVQVTEIAQPELHALIREICRQVRAPLPSRVQVDCQVNASASVRGSGLGILRRDIDLTIGLPLVAGLTIRQLSGVLAHEFGHFAQDGGLRMTGLIRGVNFWLYRVVHERDAWDEKLETWGKNADQRVVIALALARASVWLTRRVLTAVMMLGHGVSCYMLRQMEFDADSYEVKIAGSDAFARTIVRLRELSAGSHLAYKQVQQSKETRTIPADLSTLCAEYSRRLPVRVREQAQNTTGQRTGMFDTHPCDADRVAAAEALATNGALIGGDGPAAQLFRDFECLSATATRHHYERDLGLDLEAMELVSSHDAIRRAETRLRTESAMRDCFRGRVSILRPLRIMVDESAEAVTDLDATFAELRDAMRDSTLSEQRYRNFEQLQRRRDLAFCAEQLLRAGVTGVSAKQFSLSPPTLAVAQSTQRVAMQEQDKLRVYLDRFDELVARRLGLGVMRLERRCSDDEARRLAVAVTALAGAIPSVIDAQRLLMALHFLDRAVAAVGSSLALGDRRTKLCADVEACRVRVLEGLNDAPVPPGDLEEDWRRLLSASSELSADDVMPQVRQLYWASLSRLVCLVSDTETGAAGESGRVEIASDG